MDKQLLSSPLKTLSEKLAGKIASQITEILIGRKDVNEFKIAEKTGLTINQVRNVLYKLAEQNLVSAIRKKDKKKGWYIYYWTLDVGKALDLLSGMIKHEINVIEKTIKSRETKSFYACPICETEFSEENALLHEFTCPECGEVLVLADPEKYVSSLKKRISSLVKELEEIEQVRQEFLEQERKKAKVSAKKTKAKKTKTRKAKTKKKSATKNSGTGQRALKSKGKKKTGNKRQGKKRK